MVLLQWAVMNEQIPWQASVASGQIYKIVTFFRRLEKRLNFFLFFKFQKSLFYLLRKYIQLRKYNTEMHQLNEIYYRKQICYFQNSHAE
jgi:hypothetical protein